MNGTTQFSQESKVISHSKQSFLCMVVLGCLNQWLYCYCFFHQSALKLNTAVSHSVAKVSLILHWAMCILWSVAKNNCVSWKTKAKILQLCQMNTMDNHVFIAIPHLNFAFQFSSLWLCYQLAHMIIFSPLPRSF